MPELMVAMLIAAVLVRVLVELAIFAVLCCAALWLIRRM